MNNHQVSLKNILISIGILFVIGAGLLLIFGKDEKGIYVPSTFEIGNKSGLLTGLVVVYILFSILILWIFFSPTTTSGKLATAGSGILWGIF